MGHRPAVLVIGGSDSSGGAGLVRDIQSLEALGADALCAVTAVTAQSDSGVHAVHAVPAGQVYAQIRAAFATRAIGAVKIGMLVGTRTVQQVVRALGEAPALPVVLDPVVRASSGGTLLESDALEVLRTQLFPLTTLVTPNIPEAAMLAGESEAHSAEDSGVLAWAHRIVEEGARGVLIKGGHAAGPQVIDVLVRADAPALPMSAPRLASACRGTGCALASAIAAALAGGADLPEACRMGRAHVRALLERVQDPSTRPALG